jgi:beta-lactamase class A
MNEIEKLIAQADTEVVAVAFRDLQTGREFFAHADDTFHPASTFKVGVMMEVFHQAAQGLLSLDDEIPVVNSFSSIADGSSFSVFAQDDSETTLYKKIGASERVHEIVRLMIVRSSNFATNILIQKVGAAHATAYLRELGVDGVQILRGPEDNRAFASGMNNSATARGLMQMMQVIAEEKAVSPDASTEMIEILLQQEFAEGIPARLPKTVKVAHKTGWNDNLYHDFGIVFAEKRKPYILAIMTRGFKQETEAHQCVAEISEQFYKTLTSA